jgi:hypothetical protein
VLTAVLPAHNEAGNIGRSIAAAQEALEGLVRAGRLDDWDNDGTSESAPPDVGFGGDDGDGLSSEELVELTATVAAQQEAIVALEEFQASSLGFIGHMTDDEHWSASSSDEGDWRGLESLHSSGQENWRQGPNGDAIRAYEDCFKEGHLLVPAERQLRRGPANQKRRIHGPLFFLGAPC